MARTAVIIPDTFALDWVALPTTEGNIGGVAVKPLSRDEATGGATFLVHLPPGWHDPQLDWHPATEESFKLAGWSRSGDRESGTPSYIYRPPGLLHGPTVAEATLGATFIARFDGDLSIIRVAAGAQDQPMGPEYAAEGLIWHSDIDAVERRPAPAEGPGAGAALGARAHGGGWGGVGTHGVLDEGGVRASRAKWLTCRAMGSGTGRSPPSTDSIQRPVLAASGAGRSGSCAKGPACAS